MYMTAYCIPSFVLFLFFSCSFLMQFLSISLSLSLSLSLYRQTLINEQSAEHTALTGTSIHSTPTQQNPHLIHHRVTAQSRSSPTGCTHTHTQTRTQVHTRTRTHTHHLIHPRGTSKS